MPLIYKNFNYYWNGIKISKNLDSIGLYNEVEKDLKDLKVINADITNNAYNDLIEVAKTMDELFTNNAYLKELEKCTKRMTVDDFYIQYNNYKYPDYTNKLSNVIPYAGILRNNSWQLANLRNFKDHFFKLHEDYERLAKNIIKGHNSETQIGVYLDNELEAETLILLNTVFIDKYENDLIIISDKGLFTLEIKDHKCKMEWCNGEFIEHRGRIQIKDVSNPYKQAINHKRTLEEVLNSKYHAESFILLSNDKTTYDADDKNILNSIYYIDEFIEFFNNLKPIYTSEQTQEIYDIIQEKRLNKEYLFEYPDIYRIDELYRGWVEKLAIIEYTRRNNISTVIKMYEKYKNYKLPKVKNELSTSIEYFIPSIIRFIIPIIPIMMAMYAHKLDTLFKANFIFEFLYLITFLFTSLYSLYSIFIAILDTISFFIDLFSTIPNTITNNKIGKYIKNHLVVEINNILNEKYSKITADYENNFE